MRRRLLVFVGLLLALAGAALLAWLPGRGSSGTTAQVARPSEALPSAPELQGAAGSAPTVEGGAGLPALEMPELGEGEGWLIGRVLTPDGAPCPGAWVECVVQPSVSEWDEGLGLAEADAHGRFAIAGRASEPVSGPMALHARHEERYVRVPVAAYVPGKITDVGDIQLRGDLLAITGRVVGEGEVPLEADVAIYRERGQPPERGWRERYEEHGGEHAGDDGVFRCPMLPAGSYRLTVKVGSRTTVFEHIAAGTSGLVLRIPGVTPRPRHVLRLRVRGPGATGAGPVDPAYLLWVMDRYGDLLVIRGEEGSDACTVEAEGQPPFDLWIHSRTTEHVKARCAPLLLTGLVPREEPYEAVLTAGHVLRGRVLQDGRPVNAKVKLTHTATGKAVPHLAFGDAIEHDSCTDLDGEFEFTGLPAGQGTLSVQLGSAYWAPCAGAAPERGGERVISRIPPQPPRTVRLDTSGPLLISIEPRGTRPIEVEWPAGEPWPDGPPWPETSLIKDGSALQPETMAFLRGRLQLTVAGLAADWPVDVAVCVKSVGWAHLPGLVPGVEPVRARLTPCSRVRGRVLDSAGAPVAKADVHGSLECLDPALDCLLGGSVAFAETDEEGRFDLRPYGTGRCSLRAEDALERKSPFVTAQTDGPPVELRLAPLAIASGRIVGVDLHTNDEYYVLVVPHGADHEGEPVAESDGFFEVSWPGVVPATLIARNYSDLSDGRVAVLEVPKTGGDDLRLVLKPGFTVKGRVVDALGQPAPDVKVTIRGRWTRDEFLTGADGRFTCLPQPDDALELHVRAVDGREVRRAVKPGEIEIVLPAR